ncbi:DUF4913 domain-containing protein [Citricoccus nitrophenolicus]|uniref:DUF4913 domain-containing protein n=1 Tax=Citricoccus nitrophenolicus TaxID=863575 RepID=UPI0039B581FE
MAASTSGSTCPTTGRYTIMRDSTVITDGLVVGGAAVFAGGAPGDHLVNAGGFSVCGVDGGRRWDPQWWRYEEAGTILEALWESWEQMRWEDAMTAVVWYRDYFWPVMDRLTAEDGPFWDYDPPRSTEVPPQWQVSPAPKGWF